ncbi:glutathione-dependent formaldehyde-activating protein, partial [Mycena epipterygia]
YNGNCHCGAIKYIFLSPESLSSPTACDCSICSKVRCSILDSSPYPATNTIIYKNKDALVEYIFGKKRTFHGFCGICGVAVRERFAGAGRDHEMMLNVHTMNGLNLAALKMGNHDPKLVPPLYEL